MKIERNYIKKEMNIEDFADKHNLIMEINERSPGHDGLRYYAHFKRVEVKKGVFLVGVHGDGVTPEYAINNYAELISGKTVVYNPWRKGSKTLEVPILRYS